MNNHRREEKNRYHQSEDWDYQREKNRYKDGNEAMHQRNWNKGENYHGDNYGLGDTSQGSGNYGHPDQGRGARYYGTGDLGGYFPWAGEDSDEEYSNRARRRDKGDRNDGSSYDNDHDDRRYGQKDRYRSEDRYGHSSNYKDDYRNRRYRDAGRSAYDRGDRSSDDLHSRNYETDRGDRRAWNNDRDWWDKTSDEVASWFGDDEAERRREMDSRYGGHAGKGPKGYTRSDEKIKDDVEERLYHDDYVDASDIEVSVEKGDVTLKGTVNDRNTKRRAEYCAEVVTGVVDVSNNLKIKLQDTSYSNYGVAGTTGMASGTTPPNVTNPDETGNTDPGDQSKDLDRRKNK